jgi:hypothetical protein
MHGCPLMAGVCFCRGRGHKVNPEFHDFFAAGKLARQVMVAQQQMQ